MVYNLDLLFLNSTKNTAAVRDYLTGLAVNLFSDGITILLGLVANFWLFASIFSSKPLRSKPRNVFICSISLVHLLKVFYFFTLQFLHLCGHPSLIIFYTKCADVEYTYSANLMERIVVKYQIFLLCAVYLYDIAKLYFEYNTHADKTKETYQKTLVVIPWIIGLIVTRPNLAWFGFGGLPCTNIYCDTPFALLAFYFLGPIISIIGITTLAIFLRNRLHRKATVLESGKVSVRRLGGEKLDTPPGYIAAVAVCVLCDAGQAVRTLGLAYSYNSGYTFQATSVAIDTSRMVLLPLIWLFFLDIRHRLWTWRPSFSPVLTDPPNTVDTCQSVKTPETV